MNWVFGKKVRYAEDDMSQCDSKTHIKILFSFRISLTYQIKIVKK
jgi:hypothetical protein